MYFPPEIIEEISKHTPTSIAMPCLNKSLRNYWSLHNKVVNYVDLDFDENNKKIYVDTLVIKDKTEKNIKFDSLKRIIGRIRYLVLDVSYDYYYCSFEIEKFLGLPGIEIINCGYISVSFSLPDKIRLVKYRNPITYDNDIETDYLQKFPKYESLIKYRKKCLEQKINGEIPIHWYIVIDTDIYGNKKFSVVNVEVPDLSNKDLGLSNLRSVHVVIDTSDPKKIDKMCRDVMKHKNIEEVLFLTELYIEQDMLDVIVKYNKKSKTKFRIIDAV